MDFRLKYKEYLSLIDSIPKEWKESLQENCIAKCTANLYNGPVFKINEKFIYLWEAKCKSIGVMSRAN